MSKQSPKKGTLKLTLLISKSKSPRNLNPREQQSNKSEKNKIEENENLPKNPQHVTKEIIQELKLLLTYSKISGVVKGLIKFYLKGLKYNFDSFFGFIEEDSITKGEDLKAYNVIDHLTDNLNNLLKDTFNKDYITLYMKLDSRMKLITNKFKKEGSLTGFLSRISQELKNSLNTEGPFEGTHKEGITSYDEASVFFNSLDSMGPKTDLTLKVENNQEDLLSPFSTKVRKSSFSMQTSLK